MTTSFSDASPRPFTRQRLLDDPQEFHFAIIPDRTGDERRGFFGDTMRALNLLRPEFTICVGDLVQGTYGLRDDEERSQAIRSQWDDLEKHIATLDMRFYYVVGNHDINLGWPGNHSCYDVTKREWVARHGEHTYYDFIYKGVHFVCLDSMEGRDGRLPVQGITDQQYAWARQVIREHSDARWTIILMHMPIDWTSDKWLQFERDINQFNYTVFCGDWHNHVKAVRHGKNYYMIGTCGGCFDHGVTRDDLRYGIMDSITWVTITSQGPVVANLQLSGIFGDEVQRCATTRGWIETPLDYPDHKTIADGLDAERDGNGYDWHFRHAMILRNDAFVVKPEIIIAGDGIIHRWGGWQWYGDSAYPRPAELDRPFFNDHRVLNMGCDGDHNENLLWRLRHGEGEGTNPRLIILHIGAENLKAGEAPEQVAAGVVRNVHAFRHNCPGAQIAVLGPLEEVPGGQEFNACLQTALAGVPGAAFHDLQAQYRQGGTAALEEYFLHQEA